MAKRGKKYLEFLKKIEQGKEYALQEALQLLKENCNSKANNTIEVHMKLGVDPKHADQVVTEIKEELGEDGEAPGFHIEQVRCLGCCTAAPAVEVDGEIVDKDSAKSTITKLKGEK